MAKTTKSKQVKSNRKPAKKSVKTNSTNDRIVIFVLSLVLGLAGGFGLATALNDNDTANTATRTQMEDVHSGQSHAHGMFEVDSAVAPSVEIVVEEDKKSGFNVTIQTSKFTFAPESVNQDNVVGEGHAHLYVGGEKVARLYSPHFHWNGSFEGMKEFRVTLNSNDHSEYAVNSEVIEASVTVSHDSSSAEHDKMHME